MLADDKTQPEATVLLQAIPRSDTTHPATTTADSKADDAPPSLFEPICRRESYKIATGLLGKSEAAFWRMTMCGLMLQCEAYVISQGVEVAEVGLPASLAELHTLMKRFPDTIH